MKEEIRNALFHGVFCVHAHIDVVYEHVVNEQLCRFSRKIEYRYNRELRCLCFEMRRQAGIQQKHPACSRTFPSDDSSQSHPSHCHLPLLLIQSLSPSCFPYCPKNILKALSSYSAKLEPRVQNEDTAHVVHSRHWPILITLYWAGLKCDHAFYAVVHHGLKCGDEKPRRGKIEV